MAQRKRGGRRTRRYRKRQRTRRRRRVKRTRRRRHRRSKALSKFMRNVRRRTRRRRGGAAQRGGSKLGRLYPAPAFPPGGMYQPGSATNGLGKGYYYGKLQKPCLPDPKSTNTIVGQSGGNAVVESIPGGTDIRDLGWKAIAAGKNAFNGVWGFEPVDNPRVDQQPIEESSNLQFNPSPDIDVVQVNASNQAAKFKI